jgi:hypothetical protein
MGRVFLAGGRTGGVGYAICMAYVRVGKEQCCYGGVGFMPFKVGYFYMGGLRSGFVFWLFCGYISDLKGYFQLFWG